MPTQTTHHSSFVADRKTDAAPLVADERHQCRFGAGWFAQLVMMAALGFIAWGLLHVVGDSRVWMSHRMEVLIALGGLAFWRWSWFVIQNVRALIYRYYVFPRLRKAAARAVAKVGPVPEVIVLATTYHEKPWITAPVFESIFQELATLAGLVRRSRVIVVTGCDDDDRNVRIAFDKCCGPGSSARSELWPPELVLLRGDKGKRPALGAGMEEIARGNPHEEGVVIILDGDTMMSPGLFAKVMPVFRLDPPVDAITTNENNLVKGPSWFGEWTSLRFGLRHRSMCSISLSGRLLCLTGRFSVFRASVVTNPSFRRQVENDVIEHWLWGSFAMLSGDDKSTWYWLAAHQRRLLYIPDAMVTTYEVIPGLGVHRALANIRRWSGNSVRHSWRAIKLGPRKLGWFAWWCLMDQRLTMVTILFGPAVAILAMLAGRWEMVAGYFLWILCSRICHASIAWRQGRRFSAFYVPLQILSDWATALTKLWVLFHPAKQNWMNRGKRTLNTTRGSAFYGLRSGFAHYLYAFTCATILIVIGCLIGILPVSREARLFLHHSSKPRAGQVRTSGDAPKAEVMVGTASPLHSISTDSRRETPGSGPKVLMLRPWVALKSTSRDAESNHRKRVEPLLHEQNRP